MTPLNQNCRLSQLNDIPQIARLHQLAFPEFFLTKLGHKFLEIMYRTFLLDSGGVFVVNEENGCLNGFAVGVLKSSGKDRRLAVRFLPQFILAILPAVAKNPVIVLKRLSTQFFAAGYEPEIPDGAVVLRSIGVLPSVKGTGVAERLLIEFEQQAKSKGAKTVALTTDALQNERAIKFYRKNGYEISKKFNQDMHRAMLFMIKELHY